ncbi:spry domain-containing socs box protein [Anaeramoeba flamelloides]|uniref:Spry domain-containing socs box protein n=1 Tax=Anaeramoeba flamelloides TaxID=1746091 RepID=A0ABQ8XKW1_9EUKA|nr:spry domain-containing socs box protein [Anaeramoeba flamelloides]
MSNYNKNCEEHSKPLTYYCKTCNVLGCDQCLEILHREHTHYTIDKAYKSFPTIPSITKNNNEKLKKLANQAHKEEIKYENSLGEQEREFKEISKLLDQGFEKLYKILEEKKKELKMQLEKQFLTNQEEKIQRLKNLKSATQTIDNLALSYGQMKKLESKSDYLGTVSYLPEIIKLDQSFGKWKEKNEKERKLFEMKPFNKTINFSHQKNSLKQLGFSNQFDLEKSIIKLDKEIYFTAQSPKISMELHDYQGKVINDFSGIIVEGLVCYPNNEQSVLGDFKKEMVDLKQQLVCNFDLTEEGEYSVELFVNKQEAFLSCMVIDTCQDVWDSTRNNTGYQISNNGRTVFKNSSVSSDVSIIGTEVMKPNTGLWKFKVKIEKTTGRCIHIGIVPVGFTGRVCEQGWIYDICCKSRAHQGYDEATYGELCKDGDIVSILVDTDKGELSFERNGKNLGVCYRNLRMNVTIGVDIRRQGDGVTIL